MLVKELSAAEEESSADALRAAVAELTRPRSRGLSIAEARASEKAAHGPRRSFESQKKGNAVALRRPGMRELEERSRYRNDASSWLCYEV